MNLSKHFTLREFTKSQTAERKGITNEPNEDQIEAMEALCEEILEPLRSTWDKAIHINSGFRSPELCEAIGSKSTSQHCKGQAADIEIYGLSNQILAKHIEAFYDFDQLILECWDDSDPNSGWVHISYVSNAENRKDVLTYSKETGYTKGIE
jgi:zinc D-Ala-D-Ala carboxypeptidase|tara:strand:- start:241 stop:696 length:456 start_codon:yes stop_codon:yes gene_type:complete